MLVSQNLSCIARKRRIWLYLTISLLLSSFLIVSCSNPLSGGNPTPTGPTVQSTSAQVALTKLSWCPSQRFHILFRDEHATPTPVASATATTTPVSGTPTPTATKGSTPTVTSTGTSTVTPTPSSGGGPTTITDWSQVEPNLGFDVYLPTTLPQGTCLDPVFGTLHDPVLGGSFNISYQLPNHSAITITETPQPSSGLTLQCNPSNGSSIPKISATTLVASPTPSPSASPLLECIGVKGSTKIGFSEQGNTAALTQFFNALQPNINWVPVS